MGFYREANKSNLADPSAIINFWKWMQIMCFIHSWEYAILNTIDIFQLKNSRNIDNQVNL